MFCRDFQGDEFSIDRKRSGEPDGAVRAERSDLEDSASALNSRHEVEQLSLRGRYVDCGEIGGGVGFESCIQYGIVGDEVGVQILVDCGPKFFIHREKVWDGDGFRNR